MSCRQPVCFAGGTTGVQSEACWRAVHFIFFKKKKNKTKQKNKKKKKKKKRRRKERKEEKKKRMKQRRKKEESKEKEDQKQNPQHRAQLAPGCPDRRHEPQVPRGLSLHHHLSVVFYFPSLDFSSSSLALVSFALSSFFLSFFLSWSHHIFCFIVRVFSLQLLFLLSCTTSSPLRCDARHGAPSLPLACATGGCLAARRRTKHDDDGVGEDEQRGGG